MAVQGIKAQVVSVVWMHLPHFVQDDSKLHCVLQGHCKTVIFVNLKVHAEKKDKVWLRELYTPIVMLCIMWKEYIVLSVELLYEYTLTLNF